MSNGIREKRMFVTGSEGLLRNRALDMSQTKNVSQELYQSLFQYLVRKVLITLPSQVIHTCKIQTTLNYVKIRLPATLMTCTLGHGLACFSKENDTKNCIRALSLFTIVIAP
jgi:hypothetical protein